MGHCHQLRLLLWKNHLLKTRRGWATCGEILVPIIGIVILIIIRQVVNVEDVQETIIQQPHMMSGDLPNLFTDLACGNSVSDSRFPLQQLAFAADQTADPIIVGQIMTYIHTYLKAAANQTMNNGYVNCCPHNPFGQICYQAVPDNYLDTIVHQYRSGQEIDQYYGQHNYGVDEQIQTLSLAFIFTSTEMSNWNYLIRGNSTDVPSTGDAINNFLINFEESTFYQYYNNHILTIKTLIDRWILQHANSVTHQYDSDEILQDVNFLPFPIAAHQKDNFKLYLQQIIGLFMVCCFMWPFSRLVRNMVEEKERKLKEGMKMMGLTNGVYWISWLITYFVLFLILVVLACAITHSSLFKYTNPIILGLFLFSFCLSLLSLAALVTTFFSRAKTAGTISPFILILMYMPYFSVGDATKDENSKNATCLLSPVAFSLGVVNIISWESVFIGAQADNTNVVVDNFRLATAIAMMLFDFVLYGVLAWYFDLVWPTEYGTQLPWYFLVTPSYWRSCCNCSKKKATFSNEHSIADSDPMMTPQRLTVPLMSMEQHVEPIDADANANADIEPVPDSMNDLIGVKVRNLRKQFPGPNKQPVVAVHGLNLDLYKGQIFVLLGHNGAGKTTTISMLNGMISPSSGTAEIYGCDINNDMKEIRSFIGVCPQHDVLWDDLTVSEHLLFFGRLKGIPSAQLPLAVMEAIEEVKLTAKANEKASALSGGQRRRLSLAISLIGDSKVVFLDEPTSGVDPFSRRAIWDLLNMKKEGRVIVLTTHFMDEADQLGDRIGIMHKGDLKCCGSSLFLKRRYGVGYCMTITKKSNKTHSTPINRLVTTHIPEAAILSDIGSELSFSLPFGASSSFPSLLSELDSQLESLQIQSYGLSVTTLEEVFLKVAHEQAASPDQIHEDREAVRKLSSRSNSINDFNELGSIDALSANPGHSYFTRHFSALVKKRFNVQKRDKRALCCQIIVPLILLAVGLGILRIPPDHVFPTMNFTTEHQYDSPNYMPYNDLFYSGIVDNIHSNEAVLEVFSGQTYYEYASHVLINRTDHQQSRYGGYYSNVTAPASVHSKHPFFSSYTVLSNVSAIHGLPTFLNIANAALLRNITGNPTASITCAVQPFSWTERQQQVIQDINGIFASIVISFGFSFIPASFAVFIVSEREQKSKHLQLISGVSMTSYWVANYVWDLVAFLIPGTISAIIIYAYANPNFTGDNFGPICVSFIFYGISIIPFTYMCSFAFTSHSTAQNVMIMVYLVGGVILTMVSFALYLIPSTRDVASPYVRHVFRLIPNFCLGDAIFYLSVREFLDKGKWEMEITGYDILYMSLEALVYFALTLLIENLSNNPAFMARFQQDPPIKQRTEEEVQQEDEDVRAERQRCEQMANGQIEMDSIVLDGLSKAYPSKVAVKDLYFGVPAGQCFGFLGVNGAGKTTTLKMLTGDAVPSRGRAFIGGYNIADYPIEVRRLMGYCPQFDALHGNLTAEETLQFYGRIRGIPEQQLPAMVAYLIDRLSLREYCNRPAGTYSGGNKRKLCVAIALIGNPPVVFLDEPSTGMDPVSRRFMWDFISETMTNRAVILTTHSMEECEALCSRIGILVSGELKCIGSSQHLKTRFGRGFQLDISTGANDVQQARTLIEQSFVGCEQIECYGSNLKYKIPPGSSLRSIFALIESRKNECGITEYSVGQTTLEQLFIQFAKQGDDQPDMLEQTSIRPPQAQLQAQFQSHPYVSVPVPVASINNPNPTVVVQGYPSALPAYVYPPSYGAASQQQAYSSGYPAPYPYPYQPTTTYGGAGGSGGAGGTAGTTQLNTQASNNPQ